MTFGVRSNGKARQSGICRRILFFTVAEIVRIGLGIKKEGQEGEHNGPLIPFGRVQNKYAP
jgi:hypothetical protein